MYENINIETNNCCYIDGYFYIIDIDLGVLISKSAGGNVLFSYPIYKQITSVPIKLDFDGVYFFSLHLENNRNIIRKWRLVNYTLDFIKEYDYSSIGLLSSKTSVFKKYFNRPITYGDWVEGSITTGGEFVINYNELVVLSFGANNYNWHGPNITKNFEDLKDFKFNLKYKVADLVPHYTSINLIFKKDETEIYKVVIKSAMYYLYDNGSIVVNAADSYVKGNAYNYVEFKRYDEKIELVINNVVLFVDDTNDLDINNFTLGIYQYGAGGTEDIDISSVILNSYAIENKIYTNTLVIDNYKSTLIVDSPAGSDYIELDGNNNLIDVGTLIYLGDPNTTTYEEVTITGALGGNKYGLNFFTYFEHKESDPVSFSKNFYMFNNFQRTEEAGSLYKLNSQTGYVEDMFDNNNYFNILAACFFYYKNTYLCGFMNQTNFISLDINNDMSLFDVMNVENVKTDDVTVITVYDVDIHDGSLYRLQLESNYYGEDYEWLLYNYQLTPIRPFIDSTTIQAVPVIMNADGISNVEVTTLAKDQYAQEIINIRVKFFDDDDVGYMTIQDTYTGITGKAVSYYKSGIVPREVTLTSEVIQEV